MQRRRTENSTNGLLILLVLVIAALVILLITCRHSRAATNPSLNSTAEATDELLLPALHAGDEIVRHSGYTLSYNEDHEQASWVAYILTAEETRSASFARTNHFLPDPQVPTHSANAADYENSGYDRGHLAAAEDMAWSATTMKESFYYSNMSPQLPAFNRGVWKRLEELVRFWSTEYDSLYVVTGPVLRPDLPAIGPDRVSVPDYYYKVLLRYKAGDAHGIGFVLPNAPSAATLKSFAVPIDSIEGLTGIDFFPALPDPEERKLEADGDPSVWKWTRK